MAYRYEATSIEGLVQQIATCLMRHGYLFWITGQIPPRKADRLAEIDAEIIARYNVGLSRRKLCSLKAQGIAVQQYLRFGLIWVVVSTDGTGVFQEDEKPRHFSFHPLEIGMYAIDYRTDRFGRGKHARVSIRHEEWQLLRDYTLEALSIRKSAGWIATYFWNLPYEPYWGVRKQLFNLLSDVNRKRKKAGLEKVEKTCIRLKRKVVKVFEPVPEEVVVEDEASGERERTGTSG